MNEAANGGGAAAAAGARAQPGRPAAGAKQAYVPVPTEWKVELPEHGSSDNWEFGGCRSIESGYDRKEVLGVGTYGEVYRAIERATGEVVAAKKIKMDNEKEGFPITAIREIKILSNLATAENCIDGVRLRDNVITLREIVRSGSHKANNYKGSIYMIFDYMDHDMSGLLDRAKQRSGGFSPPQVKCYMRQLLRGLALLNSQNVLHRDLKNANLLVNNSGILKIADFGLARYCPKSGGAAAPDKVDAKMTNRVITLWYRPPELFLGADKYGPEIDMWSAGCIMFELLSGKPLFPGRDETEQVEKIFTIMGRPTEANMPGCSQYSNYKVINPNNPLYPATSRLRRHLESKGVKDPLAIDLLERLLALDPTKRIMPKDSTLHDWFFAAPMPLEPGQLPQYQSSHEMTMKKQRQQERGGGGGGGAGGGQQRRQPNQPPQQQQQQQQQQQPDARRQRVEGQYTGQYTGPVAPQYPGRPQPGHGGPAPSGAAPPRGGGFGAPVVTVAPRQPPGQHPGMMQYPPPGPGGPGYAGGRGPALGQGRGGGPAPLHQYPAPPPPMGAPQQPPNWQRGRR